MTAATDVGASGMQHAPTHPPRRVLLLVWAGVLRGAERHVFDLAASLPSYGYQPTICFFSRAESYGPVCREAGIEFVELDNRNTKFDWRGLVRFVSLLRHGKFDLVHDHGVALWARPAVRMVASGVPLVYTEHITRSTPLRRMAYKLLIPFTNAHIAVSVAARDALVQQLGVADCDVTIIPNSVNPERFVVLDETSRREVRQNLGLPLDSVVMISVGRLTKAKQFDRLIDWLGPVLAHRSDAHLVVVGDGEELPELVAQIASTGMQEKVHLLGNRMDVPAVLGASDLFVFASREESFGIAVAEAMLAGKPVVALRIPGVEEVVDQGITGVLVDPDRANTGFVLAVRELLDDLPRRVAFGSQGRARALSLFRPELMVSRVVGLYESLLSAGASHWSQ